MGCKLADIKNAEAIVDKYRSQQTGILQEYTYYNKMNTVGKIIETSNKILGTYLKYKPDGILTDSAVKMYMDMTKAYYSGAIDTKLKSMHNSNGAIDVPTIMSKGGELNLKLYDVETTSMTTAKASIQYEKDGKLYPTEVNLIDGVMEGRDGVELTVPLFKNFQETQVPEYLINDNVTTTMYSSENTVKDEGNVTKMVLEGPTKIFDVFNQFIQEDATTPSGWFVGKEGNLVQEFLQYQMDVLRKVEEAYNAMELGNITLDIVENHWQNTIGEVDVDTRQIKMNWNRAKHGARKSEVFLHETLHPIVHAALGKNRKLRKLLSDLRHNIDIDPDITYEIFLQGNENPTAQDIADAKDKYSYSIGSAAHPEEFFVYALTNEMVWYSIKDKTAQSKLIEYVLPNEKGEVHPMGKILNKILQAVNEVWNAMTGRTQKGTTIVTEALNTLLVQQYQLEQEHKKSQEAPTGALDKMDHKMKKAEQGITRMLKKADAKISKIWASKDPFLTKLNKIKIVEYVFRNGIIQYIYKSVTKRTTNKQWAHMYRLMRRAKAVIEGMSKKTEVAIRAKVSDLLDGVDEGSRKAITNVIFRTDLSSVLSIANGKKEVEEYINKVIDSKEATDKLIAEYKADIIKGLTEKSMMTKEEIDGIMAQLDGLGEYMVHKTTSVHNQQLNVNDILKGYYHGGGADHKALGAMTEPVKLSADMYVTLVALNNVDMHDRKMVSKLLKDGKKESINKLIVMYRNYMDDMIEASTTDGKQAIAKGYIEAPKSSKRFDLISKSKLDNKVRQSLGKIGILVGDVHESVGKINGVEYYKIVGADRNPGYKEGTIGIISSSIDGVSVKKMIYNTLMDTHVSKNKKQPDTKSITEHTELFMELLITKPEQARKVLQLEDNVTIIPVHNAQGAIVDYKIQQSRAEQLAYMEQEENIEDVLAYTFSRANKLVITKAQNKQTVREIIKYAKKHALNNPDDFIEIGEYTEEDELAGKKRTDANDRWDMIPAYTKQYIKKVTGQEKLVVEKDMVDDIFGYHKVTAGNMKLMNFDMKNHDIARDAIIATENGLREIAGYLKNLIVVLTPNVVVGNITSNSVVGSAHGIRPDIFADKFVKRWVELDDYQDMVARKLKYEIALKSGEDVKSDLKQITKRLEEHRFYRLVKDGQFMPIQEDIRTDAGMDGPLATWAKKKLGDTKAMSAIKPIYDIVYISKTTSLYNKMLKLTLYGDPVTKQIIIEKMIREKVEEKLGRKVPKMNFSQQLKQLTEDEINEVYDYVDQLLVQYGNVDNKYVDYGDNVLFIFFTKYLLRQLKAMYDMLIRKPIGLLGYKLGEAGLSVDIADPLDTYARNPIDSIMSRFMGDKITELLYPRIDDIIPDTSAAIQF